MDTRHGMYDSARAMRLRNVPEPGAHAYASPGHAPVTPPKTRPFVPRVVPLAPGVGSALTTMRKSMYPVEAPWRHAVEARFAPRDAPAFEQGVQTRLVGR